MPLPRSRRSPNLKELSWQPAIPQTSITAALIWLILGPKAKAELPCTSLILRLASQPHLTERFMTVGNSPTPITSERQRLGSTFLTLRFDHLHRYEASLEATSIAP